MLNVALILCVSLLVITLARAADIPIAYPQTKIENVLDEIHGTKVADPYRWLEDAKQPDVQAWMKTQDAFARERLKALPGRDAIAERLRKLYYVDDIGVPQHHGSRYFYWRRHANKEKMIVYWKEGKDGGEQVLFDPNTWSADGSVSLGAYSITEDGRTVAYTVHKNNSDEATLYVMDVASGKKSEIDTIEGAKYANASWTPDGSGFYYTYLPNGPEIKVADRPGFAEVRFHKLGTDPKTDALIHERTGDPTKFIGASISRDGHWLTLFIHDSWSSNQVYFRDLRENTNAWTHLAGEKKFHYQVFEWKDQFYIVTDEDAPHARMFKVDPKNFAREQWKEIVTERPDATLEEASVVGERLSLKYLVNAATQLEVRDLEGKLVRKVELPGVGSAGGLFGKEDEDEAYFVYVSFTTPRQVYQTSVQSGETKLWAKLELDVDPAPFTVDQVWYTSKDGTKVSMFVVHRKDWKKDGNNPTLLYGYGGFNVSLTPSFNSGMYPWLERGGVFAVANLRGGGEYGEEWHKQGMREHKQNVFDDFAAAAQYLIDEKITRPERLAVNGGSNGGLLVGAFTVQHPDLCKCVVCEVPLLDMIRFPLFGSGKTWTSEYGDPNDPQLFPSILAYSPYHHVAAGTKYPALLMLSADSDDRVDPMHARKFVAALQGASSGGPVLIRIEANAGHGGADLVKSAVEKGADKFAFILEQLGVK